MRRQIKVLLQEQGWGHLSLNVIGRHHASHSFTQTDDGQPIRALRQCSAWTNVLTITTLHLTAFAFNVNGGKNHVSAVIRSVICSSSLCFTLRSTSSNWCCGIKWPWLYFAIFDVSILKYNTGHHHACWVHLLGTTSRKHHIIYYQNVLPGSFIKDNKTNHFFKLCKVYKITF